MRRVLFSLRSLSSACAGLVAILQCSCVAGDDNGQPGEQPSEQPSEQPGGSPGKADSFGTDSARDVCYEVSDYCGMSGHWLQAKVVDACQFEISASSCGAKVQALMACNLDAGAACSPVFGLATVPECKQLEREVQDCYRDDPCPQMLALCDRPWVLWPEVKAWKLMECRAHAYEDDCGAEHRKAYQCVIDAGQCLRPSEKCKGLEDEARACKERNPI